MATSHQVPSDHGLIAAFFRACDGTLDIVRSDLVVDGWRTDSVLEGFTVGALVAHLYSAIRLFESGLSKPEASYERVVDSSGFYILNRVDDRAQLEEDFHVAIRTSAVQLAEQGPHALTAKFDAMVSRLRIALPDLSMDQLVPVWRIEGGATHLWEYLRTRVVELVVHADDLAVSVGLETEISPEAADVALSVLLDLARARSGDVAVMRAFTRKERADPEVVRVF